VLCISGGRTGDTEDATFAFQPATSFNFDEDRSQEASREAVTVCPTRCWHQLCVGVAIRTLAAPMQPDQRNNMSGHPTECDRRVQDTLAGQRRQSLAQLSGIRSKIGVWETKVVNPGRPRPKGVALFPTWKRQNIQNWLKF
jgi:hypothetical protein